MPPFKDKEFQAHRNTEPLLLRGRLISDMNHPLFVKMASAAHFSVNFDDVALSKTAEQVKSLVITEENFYNLLNAHINYAKTSLTEASLPKTPDILKPEEIAEKANELELGLTKKDITWVVQLLNDYSVNTQEEVGKFLPGLLKTVAAGNKNAIMGLYLAQTNQEAASGGSPNLAQIMLMANVSKLFNTLVIRDEYPWNKLLCWPENTEYKHELLDIAGKLGLGLTIQHVDVDETIYNKEVEEHLSGPSSKRKPVSEIKDMMSRLKEFYVQHECLRELAIRYRAFMLARKPPADSNGIKIGIASPNSDNPRVRLGFAVPGKSPGNGVTLVSKHDGKFIINNIATNEWHLIEGRLEGAGYDLYEICLSGNPSAQIAVAAVDNMEAFTETDFLSAVDGVMKEVPRYDQKMYARWELFPDLFRIEKTLRTEPSDC